MTDFDLTTETTRRPFDVHVLVDHNDDVQCVQGLSACHSLRAGIVVCHPTPVAGSSANRAKDLLAIDLLVALGKHPRALHAERLRHRGWDLAAAWLHAEAVKHLVVLRAHLLSPPLWEQLIATTQRAGTVLWLVSHRFGLAKAHRDIVTQLAAVGHDRPWRDGLAEFAKIHEQVNMLRPPLHLSPFPIVPEVDFLLFRAVTRRLLGNQEFERVDQAYRATFTTAQQEARVWRSSHRLGTDAPTLIQRLTVPSGCANEVVTRVRAAQAALFTAGFLLQARIGVRTPQRERTSVAPRLPDEVVTRLRMIASPMIAAAMTLKRATGLPYSEIANVRREDVKDAGECGIFFWSASQCFRVHAEAAAPIRALLYDTHCDSRHLAPEILFAADGANARDDLRAPVRRLGKRCSAAADRIGIDDGPGPLQFVEVLPLIMPYRLWPAG